MKTKTVSKFIYLGIWVLVLAPCLFLYKVYLMKRDGSDMITSFYNGSYVLTTKDFVLRDGNIYNIHGDQDESVVSGLEIPNISNFYMTANDKALLVKSHVGRRGAGQVYDYWTVSLFTLDKDNISAYMRRNPAFRAKYLDEADNLFFSLDEESLGRNKLRFNVINGWEIFSEQWEFDQLTTGVALVE